MGHQENVGWGADAVPRHFACRVNVPASPLRGDLRCPLDHSDWKGKNP